MNKLLSLTIKTKLTVLLAVTSLLVLLAGLLGLLSARGVTFSATRHLVDEMPVMRVTQMAMLALITANGSSEDAISFIKSFEDIDKISEQEVIFQKAVTDLNILLAALTWGSESESFQKSAGGLNAVEWERRGLKGSLIVKKISDQQSQLSGRASLYSAGFVNNAQKSIAKHKEFIRLRDAGEIEAANEAGALAELHKRKANRFLTLTTDTLRGLSSIINFRTDQAIQSIQNIQATINFAIPLVSVSGFIFALTIGLIFVSRVVTRPLSKLVSAVQYFSAGDLSRRIQVDSGDEIGELSSAFNTMARRLQESYSSLEKEKNIAQSERKEAETVSEKLKVEKKNTEERIFEIERLNKAMIGRELKMIELKEELKNLKEKGKGVKKAQAKKIENPEDMYKKTSML